MSLFKKLTGRDTEQAETADPAENASPEILPEGDIPEIIEEDMPPEPAPMTKEEEKELRRRMKRIVRGFRFRSFGMDGIALTGLALSALFALVLQWKIPACVTGTVSAVIAGIIELGSWISSSGEARRVHPDPQINGPWREKIWKAGVRTMRLLVILAAVEAALPFILVTADRTVSLQRWLIFGVIFAVLAVILLMILHGTVREIGYRRDILEDSTEEREERKQRRRKAAVWRMLGLLLIAVTAFGQGKLNQRDWKSAVKGQHFSDFSSFKELVEGTGEDAQSDKSGESDGSGEAVSSDPAGEDEAAPEIDPFFCDTAGNVIYRFEVNNPEVLAVDSIPNDSGDNISEFIVYTRADYEKACWSAETANMIFFSVYAVEILGCYLAFRRSVRRG